MRLSLWPADALPVDAGPARAAPAAPATPLRTLNRPHAAGGAAGRAHERVPASAGAAGAGVRARGACGAGSGPGRQAPRGDGSGAAHRTAGVFAAREPALAARHAGASGAHGGAHHRGGAAVAPRRVCAPLFAALGAFLRARQCGVVELECRLTHRHVPATRCVVRLAAPATDVQRLAGLLGERLSALSLPEPLRDCELRAAALVPHQPGSNGLWQPGGHGGSAGTEACGLIERLRARLGSEAVHGLTRLEAHRPEHAWAITEPPPAAGRRGALTGCSAAAPAAGRRPLWLLPAPQRLCVRDGLPRRRGPLRLVGEPERIETGWGGGGDSARA